MAEKQSGLKPPSRIGKPGAILMGTKSIPAQKAPSSTNSNSNAASNFIIGDKVILSGSKVGRIQFLGETEFAPGQWAGIVLEDAVGKNNGSVAGVQYFQCEPMHGVFARPSKLVRANNETAGNTTGKSTVTTVKPPSTLSKPKSATAVKTAPLTIANLKASTGETPTHERKKKGIRSPASSIRSLKFGGLGDASSVRYNEDIKVGDRVNVGDAKVGTVRFVGETEFAKGCWVGIELDSAQGKNDGSVAGNRYFTCEANFGLFALRHKVKKVTGTVAKKTAQSAVKKRPTVKSPGSSASSVSSVTSIPSLRRPSKLQSEVSSRYKQKTAATGVQALQEALVEKQQHVESLIAERDQEKSELMEVNLTAAMKQDQLNKLQEAHDQFVKEKESQLDQLRRLVEEADLEKVKLAQDLDEERRKAEDYQFQLEEGQIIKDDMEAELSKLRSSVTELNSGLHIERSKSLSLQTSLEDTRALTVDDKSELNQLRIERDEAQQQINQLNQQVESLTEQVNNSPVFELEEQLLESKSSLEETEATIAQMKINVETAEQENIKLKNLIEDSLQKHSEETSELKNQLKILAEKRNEQFTAVDAVAEKERQISSLEQDLLNANQSLESIKEEKKKTEEEVERMMLEMKSLNEDREKLEQSCKEEIKQKINLQEEVQRFKESLGAKDAEFGKIKISLDERLKMIEEKDQLCSQLNQKLDVATSCQQQLQTQLDSCNETWQQKFNESNEKVQNLEATHETAMQEVETMKSKNELLTKQNVDLQQNLDVMSKQTGDKDQTYNQQLQSARETIEQTTNDLILARQKLEQVEKTNQKLNEDASEIQKTLLQYQTENNTLSERIMNVENENKNFKTEEETLQAKVKKLEASLSLSVTAEEEREKVLKREFASERDSLQRSLDITTKLIEERTKEAESYIKEITRLKSEQVLVKTLQDQVTKLEQQKVELNVQVTTLQQSNHSNQLSNNHQVDSGAGGDAGQVDFLNKVIIDQQQKIKMLTDKIEELEGMMLDDGAGGEEAEYNGESRKLAPRLFCDICDVFDAHDTEDCPTQSMMEPDPAGASQNYERGEGRAYCEDCEAFGHVVHQCFLSSQQ